MRLLHFLHLYKDGEGEADDTASNPTGYDIPDTRHSNAPRQSQFYYPEA